MDDTRNPMMPQDPTEPQARGGLSNDGPVGGLSKFMQNVAKGYHAVVSHPLYAGAFSAMVSGQMQDPAAGPMALAQLRQMQTQSKMQRQQMDMATADEERQHELALLRQRSIQRAGHAMRNGDRNAALAELLNLDPAAALKQFTAPPASRPNPIQAMVDGQPRWVMPDEAVGLQPVPRAPLVEVRNGEMKPREIIDAEDRAAARVDSKALPLETALDAYRSFRALADKIASEGRPPTPAETDSLSKLAARLENPEAVQEGDIARKAGGSLANFFAGKAGLPYTLSLEQLSGLVSTADTIAAAKQQRLREIYSGAQGVAAGRGFDPNAVVPSANTPVQPKSQPPVGFRPHPIVPGLYVNDAGEGWVAD